MIMKKVIGLVLLLIVLVAVSGCTNQTKTAPATTVAPTEVVTTVETVAETPAQTAVETPVETVAATPVETTVEPAANVTAVSTAAPAATVTAVASMTPSTKITTVHIVNNSFSPATLMILPGTGITWVNDEATVHSVKMIGEHAGKFNSGDIVKGGSFGYTFGETVGTYEYADGHNPNLTGVIIVQKGDSLIGKVVSSSTYVTSNATW
jgi:plastocyanin